MIRWSNEATITYDVRSGSGSTPVGPVRSVLYQLMDTLIQRSTVEACSLECLSVLWWLLMLDLDLSLSVPCIARHRRGDARIVGYFVEIKEKND